MPPDLQAPVPTPLPGHTPLPRRQQTWVMPPDLQVPVPTPLPGHTPLPRRQEPWVMPPDLQGPSPPPLLLSLTGGPQASSMLPGCPSPRQAEHGMPVAPMQPPFEPPPRTLIDFLQIAKLPHRSPQQQRPPAPPTILDALRLANPPRRSQQQHHQLPPPLTILDALHEQQQQQQQQQPPLSRAAPRGTTNDMNCFGATRSLRTPRPVTRVTDGTRSRFYIVL